MSNDTRVRGTRLRNNQPKTVRLLCRNLSTGDVLTENDFFPFGKHKGENVVDVVVHDPNYVVWWNEKIKAYPIEPELLKKAEENYQVSPRGRGYFKDCFDEWDHWDNEDLME